MKVLFLTKADYQTHNEMGLDADYFFSQMKTNFKVSLKDLQTFQSSSDEHMWLQSSCDAQQ